MSTTELRRNPMAPPLPPLTPQAEVALLARMLYREGYDDHLAGHITSRQPDGTLLVNPWGLTWDEVSASDIMRIDLDGNVLEGKWTVTPAIPLHLELHKARHDIGVAVHNHPRWGTIWADLHRAPPVYDQTSAMVPGDPALYDDFGGSVDPVENARACVEALGDARMALLANHGVLVVGGRHRPGPPPGGGAGVALPSGLARRSGRRRRARARRGVHPLRCPVRPCVVPRPVRGDGSPRAARRPVDP